MNAEARITKHRLGFQPAQIRASDFGFLSSFRFGHSDFQTSDWRDGLEQRCASRFHLAMPRAFW